MIHLQFAKANSKLLKLQKKTGKKVYSFSILSGWNCPFAKDCKSFAVQTSNGLRIKDGKHTEFRCFSASQEALFKKVYETRKNNGELVKLAVSNMSDAVETVLAQLPKDCKIFRPHIGGDFRVQAYFDMWLEVARQKKDIQFYAYTKALPFWVKRLNDIPQNFNLTASFGGTKDELIQEYNLRYAKVVYSQKEARKLGLVIDVDDTHACLNRHKNQSFSLLIHGQQPANSSANKAVQLLKKD